MLISIGHFAIISSWCTYIYAWNSPRLHIFSAGDRIAAADDEPPATIADNAHNYRHLFRLPLSYPFLSANFTTQNTLRADFLCLH